MQERGPPGITLTRPSNWKEWRQAVLGQLTQAVAGLAGAAELVGAFRPGDELEEEGWKLVYGALQAAVDEAGKPLGTKSGIGQRLMLDQLLQQGDLAEIELPANFLDQSKSLPLLIRLQPIVKATLIREGLDETVADQRAARLPEFFIAALRHVWRKDVRWLDAIEKLTNASPEKNARQERAWLFYREKLAHDIARPLFGGPHTLLDLYQPLRGYWTEVSGAPHGPRSERRNVVDVATELTDWFDKSDANDALRVIGGGPGSGKSSLVKWWALQILDRLPLQPTLIVPAHRLRTFELEKEVGRLATNDGFAKNPLGRHEGEPKILLIIDGLDELDVDQERGPLAADRLVTEVRRLLREAHAKHNKLRVLLTCRELLIAALRGLFGRPRQIVHVLGYLTREQRHIAFKERPGVCWDDPRGLLDTDQRETWWQVWGGPRATDNLRAAIAGNAQLTELSDQPLLNHLLAIVDADRATALNEQTTLNDVYAAVLSHVWQRSWGDESGSATAKNQIPGLTYLTEEDFWRVFESVGLALWQRGGGRSASLDDIAEVVATEGLDRQFIGVTKAADSRAFDLLTAFFFHNEGATETFELTHKSFGEYLAAKRIRRLIDELHHLLHSDEIDGREALRRWYRWTHAARITPEILAFLEGELRPLPLADVQGRRATLVRLFDRTLRTGMAHERGEGVGEPANHRKAQEFDAAAELALLAAIGACTEAIIHLTADLPIEERRDAVRWAPAWPDKNLEARTSAWDLLRRLEAGTARDTLARQCMPGLDLDYQVVGGDLSEARLTFASARKSQLRRANLFRAELQGVDFFGADLLGANLSGADLGDAILRSATLTGANLIGAHFNRADLNDANISVAILSAADLVDVELRGLDHHGPDFSDATLIGTILTGANLRGAVFARAELTRAKLDGADLTRANFHAAISLSGATFSWADLSETKFYQADLEGADFSHAIGLTRQQLAVARNVDRAVLPDEIPEE